MPEGVCIPVCILERPAPPVYEHAWGAFIQLMCMLEGASDQSYYTYTSQCMCILAKEGVIRRPKNTEEQGQERSRGTKAGGV